MLSNVLDISMPLEPSIMVDTLLKSYTGGWKPEVNVSKTDIFMVNFTTVAKFDSLENIFDINILTFGCINIINVALSILSTIENFIVKNQTSTQAKKNHFIFILEKVKDLFE